MSHCIRSKKLNKLEELLLKCGLQRRDARARALYAGYAPGLMQVDNIK